MIYEDELRESNRNLVFSKVKFIVEKREKCRWCNDLLPNIVGLQKLFTEYNAPDAIVIRDQPKGTVPAIYIEFNIDDNTVWRFKHDNSERSIVTLLSVYLYFATIIYPHAKLLLKFGQTGLDYITQTLFAWRAPYPKDFIPYCKVEEQLYQCKYDPSPTPTTMHELFRNLTHDDMLLLFYNLNQNHSRCELLQNFNDYSLIEQLTGEASACLSATKKLALATT